MKQFLLKESFVLSVALLLISVIYYSYQLVDMTANQVTIGTTYMTSENSFYKVINNEIVNIATQNGDRVYTRNPDLSVTKQCEQLREFIVKHVDAIIINPVNGSDKTLLATLKKAKEQGIKIIVVDNDLADDSLADTTILSDNYQAGVLIAQSMMAAVDQARIILLEHQEALSGRERIQGFLKTIGENSRYQVIAREETLGRTDLGMSQLLQLLDEHQSFDVIMALNDRSALGALAALKDRKNTMPVLLYGVDGSPDLKNRIRQTDDVTATVAQSPIQMGKKSMASLYRLLQGKSVKQRQILPVYLIDKRNIEQFDSESWQ